MDVKQARKQFVRHWKAWMKAKRIRRAIDQMGCGRAGPGKAWYDECTVMMRRARRVLMACLRKRENSMTVTMDLSYGPDFTGLVMVYPDGRVRHIPPDQFYISIEDMEKDHGRSWV